MIEQFKGDYRFLSNFWFFEKPMMYDGIVYKTSEHYYMAMKSKDRSYRTEVSGCQKGSDAKVLGENVDLRQDWEDIKYEVMLFALRYKFSKHNPGLRQKLIDTGDQELQEGNWWNDKIWGVCLKTGEGQNNLGKLLMKVRAEIIFEGESNE